MAALSIILSGRDVDDTPPHMHVFETQEAQERDRLRKEEVERGKEEQRGNEENFKHEGGMLPHLSVSETGANP